MRLCVTGSRHWTDYSTIWRALKADYEAGYRSLWHGAAKGADSMAAHAAQSLGFIVTAVPVDHSRDGSWPGAGPRRNLRMLVLAQPHALRVFRAQGKSNGTDDCVRQAERMGVKVLR